MNNLLEKLSDCLMDSKAQMKCARKNKKENFEKAALYYEKYLKNHPDDIEIIIEYANLLADKKQYKHACEVCDIPLKKDYTNVNLLIIMCRSLFRLNDYISVVRYAKNALKFAKDENIKRLAYRYLADAYRSLDLNEEFLKLVEEFDLADNSANSLICIRDYYLKNKNLEKGLKAHFQLFSPKNWEEVVNRFEEVVDEVMPPYIYNYMPKMWKGEDLTGKTLFLFHYFQCAGEWIMYARYIPILAKMAKNVIIEVDENMYSLYKYNFPQCKIVPALHKEYTDIPYDYTFSIELLLKLQKDLDSFPSKDGYIQADEHLIKYMKEQKIYDTDKLKVGLFWQSDTGGNRQRSMRTRDIIPILEQDEKCKFYSLSIANKDRETLDIMRDFNVVDCAKYIKDAHDTAGIMKNLDLIITTDSFPLHLSGALGIKTFLMLPNKSCWRWFNETEKTDLYSSVKIFKQIRERDWREVVFRVAKELDEYTIIHSKV